MSKKNKSLKIKKNQGEMLLLVLTFTTIFLVMISGMLTWVNLQFKLNSRKVSYEQAIQIAEAGINYYRWHLAHDPDDYQDGTGQPGPYVHNYSNSTNDVEGQFSLEIIPPANNTNIVTLVSTGSTSKHPNIQRTIQAQYGIPSFASYSFISNSNIWFGEGENVVGELHSNGGIRMDGTNDSRITSAKDTYICGPEHGCNYEEKPGIWGTGGPQDLWDFPETSIDFNDVTTDLAELEAQAKNTGLYFAKTNKDGYHVVFLADGTFNIYKVNSTIPTWGFDTEWDWRYIDIQSESPLNPFNYEIPDNGIIYLEDNVWVEGIINGRVTLVAARFPDTSKNNKNIYINGDINYLTKDGAHVLGLMAQKDILIPRYSADTLNIDAVLLAQKGHCFRYYYPDNILSAITTYGSIITNAYWTWSWDCGGWTCSGYETSNSVYDPFVKYSPPPSFPNTGEYEFISWEEIPD